MSSEKIKRRPSRPSAILVADDDPAILHLLRYNLAKLGLRIITVENGRQALEQMSDDVCVALLDLMMPEMDGLQALVAIKERFPDVPVVMLSARGQIQDAVRAMKAGALEYITKPFDLEELLCLMQQAVRMSRSLHENSRLRQAVGSSRPMSGFAGASEATRQLLQQVQKVAPLNATVLLTGESGVGKSLLARLIHYASPRASGPFVSVSCPSLPRELLESEMFGHEKGAFTGALERRIGRVEIADGGTLFLDEIGDLPLALQPKLLTFLQERTFQRLGGSEVLEADVRIVAATNVDLRERIQLREFREDLFFRLNVLPLHLAPLRERRADLAPLTLQILERIVQERGCPPLAIPPETVELIERYSWPGNVRELENALERASAFCDGGVIRPQDLPPEIRGAAIPDAGAAPAPHLQVGGLPLAQLEALALRQTLDLCQGNRAEAARRLGISERSVYNLIARHGIRQVATIPFHDDRTRIDPNE